MGCGAWIKISQVERIHICWNGGLGCNNLAELMALWCGLLASHNMGLNDVSIFGDSKIIIDAMVGKAVLSTARVQGWLLRAQQLWSKMNKPAITHIFRENNTRADRLSKKGLDMEFGILQENQYRVGQIIWNTEIPIPSYQGQE